MMYKGALNFEYVEEILKCDHEHSNESCWAVLSPVSDA